MQENVPSVPSLPHDPEWSFVASLLNDDHRGEGGAGHTNDNGMAIGLFGRGGGEMLGGCGEFEMDGVERAVFGGGEIAEHGDAEI